MHIGICRRCKVKVCPVCGNCRNPVCESIGCKGALFKVYDCRELKNKC